MKQNNLALELKDAGDENDPATIVTKALAGFQTALDGRLKPIETKSGDDTKLKARLDAMEAKLNRPGAGLKADNDNDSKLETKTFTSYVRSGREAMDQLEVKTLIVANDAGGGYLAPAQLSTEMIRLLTLFSPVRAAAYVGQTGSPSIILPKRTGITNAKWEGEIEDSEESEPAFGQLEIPVFGMKTYTVFRCSCWRIRFRTLKPNCRWPSLRTSAKRTSAKRKASPSSTAPAISSRAALWSIPTLPILRTATRPS